MAHDCRTQLAEFYEAINGKIKRFGQGNVGTYLGDVCVNFSSWCPCLVFFWPNKGQQTQHQFYANWAAKIVGINTKQTANCSDLGRYSGLGPAATVSR